MNKKVIFWGTPEFSLPSLKVLHKLNLINLVITQADKKGGRNNKLLTSPIKDYSLKNDLPFLQPLKLDSTFIQEVKNYLPATFIIVAYGQIIPQEILNLSELQSLNIHPSKLPILRGPSPIQTALLKGFNRTAVSLMQIDEKMDHGPIIEQREAIIDEEDNYISLSKKLSIVGAKLLEDNIKDYLNNKLKSQEQDHSQATFCKLIKKEDGQIDWSNTAQNINNQIRALYPWPSTFTTIKDLDLKIIKVKISNKELKEKEILIEDNKLYIGTNTQALEILELQVTGKKITVAQEFLRGYSNKLI